MLRSRPQRLRCHARLGLPAVAVLALALGGCADPVAAAPHEPVGAAAPASTGAASTGPPSTIARTSGTAGSDGLTVRYLDDDGRVRTVPVEDFPH